MEFIKTNLKFLRKLKGWTQNDLAEALGVTRAVVGSYEEGRARPTYEVLLELSKQFKYKIDDLITRDLRQTEKVPLFSEEQLQSDVEGKHLRVLAITVDRKDNENIEMVPAKAAAGYLNGYADPEFIQELNKFRLPFLPSGTYRAFEIKGDSMLPVQPGSVIVGEYLDNWKNIKDGQTYIVLSKHDGIVYKRVFNQVEENGTLIMRSDNPSYPAYALKIDEVLEIWRAVLNISHLNKGTDLSFQNILQMMQDLKKDVEDLKAN
ncbi:MAG: helix-turn-helix domain-containing protein [Chitinophagales bacterium]|nr:helix-turn-helix domain-containing protein [Chitinophagales bacterium]